MHLMTIAIDGPAGSGKSTVARELSRRLGMLYLDTGAMYRAVTWLTLRHEVSPDDASGIVRLLKANPIHLEQDDFGNLVVWVGTTEVTPLLRTPEVSKYVSTVSAHAAVREELTEMQQTVSKEQSVVMDGRDIGTVVLPNADVKIFLTASLEERARRRSAEFEQSGFSMTPRQIQEELAQRDERDSSRSVAPLRPAPDAHPVDSTGKSVEEVVLEILSIVEQRVS